MTPLEQQLADALLTHAINSVYDVQATAARIESYRTLVSAAANNYAWSNPSVIDKDPCCDQTCDTVGAPAEPATTEEAKPATRTRRTKAQIEADKAAEAAAAPPEPSTTLAEMDPYNGKLGEILEADKSAAEPEAEEVQIDDVEPAAPKITHGKIQELFTLKSTNIAKAGGDVSGFKARLREMLAEFGSPAGISKLPEANLAAFHAKLVNLT